MILEKGTKVVCIGDLLDFTIGEIYTIHTVDLDRECFMLIDDIEENNIIDLENFNEYFRVRIKLKKDPIVKQVTDKFKARSKVGIEKYGTTLEENNTDDFLEHLQQELMDATLYIEKLKSQEVELTSIDLTNVHTDDLAIELSKRGCRITQVHYSEL